MEAVVWRGRSLEAEAVVEARAGTGGRRRLEVGVWRLRRGRRGRRLTHLREEKMKRGEREEGRCKDDVAHVGLNVFNYFLRVADMWVDFY